MNKPNLYLHKGKFMKSKKDRKKISKADSLRSQKRASIKKEKDLHKNETSLWIPSGSIMNNLACSDRWYGAYKAGTMINSVGNSSSGKSILTLSGMAESFYLGKNGLWKQNQMPDFSKYDFIYDDAEYANAFNMVKLFGPDFADAIQSPNVDEPERFSTTIEEFEDNIYARIEAGVPFIYCLDSFDALDAEVEKQKAEDNRKKRKDGKETKGSFAAAKQKYASSLLRRICSELEKMDSLLIIISQTRDNMDPMSRKKQTRSGGRALKFYASIEGWLTYIGAITKTVNGKQYQTGVSTRAVIEKNKYTGKKRNVDFPIYYDYGVDDVTECVNFLVSNKYWSKRKTAIIAPELKMECTLPKIISNIDNAAGTKKRILKRKLFQTTQICWNDIEEKLKLDRVGRFG